MGIVTFVLSFKLMLLVCSQAMAEVEQEHKLAISNLTGQLEVAESELVKRDLQSSQHHKVSLQSSHASVVKHADAPFSCKPGAASDSNMHNVTLNRIILAALH